MKFEAVEVGMDVRRTIESASNMGGMRVGDTAIVLGIKSGVGVELTKYGIGHDWGALEPVSAPSHNFHVGQPVRYRPTIRSIMGDRIYIINSLRYNIRGLVELIEPGGNKIEQHPEYFEPASEKIDDMILDPLRCRCTPLSCDEFDSTYKNAWEGMVKPLPVNCRHNLFSDKDIEKTGVDNYDKFYMNPEKLTTSADWGTSPASLYNDISIFAKDVLGIELTDLQKEFIKDMEENKMVAVVDNSALVKLAEKMKDEIVGFDSQSNTVFLKKAGEVKVVKRDITMNLTDADIEKLLKSKGLDATLGDFEIEHYSGTYTVGIVKYKPVNEAV